MIPLLFGLFACTLLAIAACHRQALPIALAGLVSVFVVRVAGTDFDVATHLAHEAHVLLNLAGLLLGFAVLADHFERSGLAERLTQALPPNRTGALLLLVLVALLSMVLDNIAAALIGGTAARTMFRGRVHLGYLAAIVAASNAGGAGSVIGDTTTTMMWIEGASPLLVAKAGVGAAVAIACFGWFASRQQHRLQPLSPLPHAVPPIDWPRVGVVALVLDGAIGANVLFDFPAAGVWAALLVGSLWRPPAGQVVRRALGGTCFLLSLVLTASMMPVASLPAPSLSMTFALGAVSAIFDNSPLTKLAIDQGGHDWGLLAYAVGYGGSLLWFGSSAGVALANVFPEARSAAAWVRHGWHVAVGFVLGFVAMVAVFGWQPSELTPPAPHTEPR